MADPAELWRWLLAALGEHEPAALLIVADSRGSSPGKAGAKMAVTADAAIGTIGGGLIETDLLAATRAMLANGEIEPRVVQRAHHPSKNLKPSGMICGGEQTVLIYPCKPMDRGAFERLRDCEASAMLVDEHGLQVLAGDAGPYTQAFIGGEDWHYRENLDARNRAFIIGGGHVGLALSKILDTLDFEITVIDEREPPDSLAANTYARYKSRMPYADIGDGIPEGGDVFVFIMTHDHHGDRAALRALAGKRFAYLGLLGSRHKIEGVHRLLAGEVSAEQWQRVHAPMGLAIGSHSPEEIAISIAAEVVQILNA